MTVSIPNTDLKYTSWSEISGENWTINQNWTIHHAFLWEVFIDEKLEIKERNNKASDAKVFEAISLSEKRNCLFNKQSNEKLAFHEQFKTARVYTRQFREKLNIQRLSGCHPEKTFQSSFHITDSLLRSPVCIISDILFEDGGWNQSDFEDAILKGKHVGYENFRPFIYGDYFYERALFRTVLDARGADRGVIEQCQIAVDVPDLVDRGSNEVIDKNYDLKIEFNKNFHIAPEVSVTMKSGDSATPVVANVVEVTEKGFSMYLQNAITGEKTTGRFIWTAVGY